MAVKDGLPSTDFSRMNREYIKAVAESGSGGGGGSVLLINKSAETLDKTGQQIVDAFTGGSLCLLVNQISEDDYTDTFYYIMAEYGQSISESEGNFYKFTFIGMGSGDIVTFKFSCTALSDNPTAVY